RQVDPVRADLGRREQRIAVRPETEEGYIAEVKHARRAHDDVEAHSQCREYQRGDPDLKLEPAQAEDGQQRAGDPRDAEPAPPADALNGPLRGAEPGRQVLAPFRPPGNPLIDSDLRAGGLGASLRAGDLRASGWWQRFAAHAAHTFRSCGRPSRPVGRA